MRIARPVLAALGLAAIVYGAQMFLNAPPATTIAVALWIVGAIVVHDGVLSPLVLAVGALAARLVPPRARRYLQFGLIAAAAVTVIAVPMIIKQGSQPPVKALLEQRYDLHLALLVGLIGAGCLVGYAIRVARDRRPPAEPDGRPRHPATPSRAGEPTES